MRRHAAHHTVKIQHSEVAAPHTPAPHTQRPLTSAFHLEKRVDQNAIDLVDMRLQLVALRSRHSENPLAARLLNALLVKISCLNEPEGAAHAQRIRDAFAKTIEAVGKLVAQNDRR
jgi:hypothetical protein